MTRKYGPSATIGDATKLIIVADASLAAGWPAIEAQVRSGVSSQLALEIWDEQHLLGMFRDAFGVRVDSLLETDVLEVRTAVEDAKGRYAFEEDWADDTLQNSLLWHFGFWQLKRLRRESGLTPRNIMPPGTYHGVVTLMADLSGFSGYVKDTRDDAIVRQSLTTFYSKARNEILNSGGMLYQFVGDEVVGLFGVPRPWDGYLEAAMDCAQSLVDIGNSVSHEWQRHLDNIQLVRGVHMGVCIGSMQIVSLRPFSRSHVSGIGQVINLASRLMAEAGPSQIVVSNTYYHALPAVSQTAFEELPAVDAKNMGRIKAWRKDFTIRQQVATSQTPRSPVS